jgi:hypothetical protein
MCFVSHWLAECALRAAIRFVLRSIAKFNEGAKHRYPPARGMSVDECSQTCSLLLNHGKTEVIGAPENQRS